MNNIEWWELLIAIPFFYFGHRYLDNSRLNCWLGNHKWTVTWGQEIRTHCERCGKTLPLTPANFVIADHEFERVAGHLVMEYGDACRHCGKEKPEHYAEPSQGTN